jgi:hypothetical protein
MASSNFVLVEVAQLMVFVVLSGVVLADPLSR